MAPFNKGPDEWQRLDWQLLQNSAITLYFSPAVLQSDIEWLAGHDYRVLSLSTREYASPQSLLVALGELLAFPDYYGLNLDAFNDCLSDVDVPESGGLVLVLRDFHLFAETHRSVAHAILDICADNSRLFLLTGRHFLVLVHSADPRLEFDPVGATPVMWNPKEWLNAKRGV